MACAVPAKLACRQRCSSVCFNGKGILRKLELLPVLTALCECVGEAKALIGRAVWSVILCIPERRKLRSEL